MRSPSNLGAKRGFFSRLWDFIVGEDTIDRIQSPHRVVADSDGAVYVADWGVGLVHYFHFGKKKYDSCSKTKIGPLVSPIGLALDDDGLLYVTDSVKRRVFVFSGTKNIFVENLTGLHGYQEGISCLACHAVRETDIKGNANYTITQPHEYLWQWRTNGLARVARDFLIRSYPAEHARLAKRSFKKPEYCAACHKQFIDREFEAAIESNPEYWIAYAWRSPLLQVLGRSQEAIASGTRAIDGDRYYPIAHMALGWRDYVAGAFEQAAQRFRRILDLTPDSPVARRLLGQALTELGRYPEAEAELRLALTRPGHDERVDAQLAYLLARTGRPDSAQAILSALKRRLRAQAGDTSIQAYVSALDIAIAHTGLGRGRRCRGPTPPPAAVDRPGPGRGPSPPRSSGP